MALRSHTFHPGLRWGNVPPALPPPHTPHHASPLTVRRDHDFQSAGQTVTSSVEFQRGCHEILTSLSITLILLRGKQDPDKELGGAISRERAYCTTCLGGSTAHASSSPLEVGRTKNSNPQRDAHNNNIASFCKPAAWGKGGGLKCS